MYNGIDNDAQYLVDMMFAPLYQKICSTAIDLEFFSHLQTPVSAADLAASMNWNTTNTTHFLNMLTGLKLVQKVGQDYFNMPVAQKYLVNSGSYYMGDFMKMYMSIDAYEEAELAALVRLGPEAAAAEKVSNVSFAEMVDLMRRGQMGARSAEIKTILSELPEYRAAKKLLDLGGGAGMMGITAARGNTGLHTVIYDTPAMKEGILQSITRSSMTDRVSVIAGDYLTDDIGSGYDMILALATLNFAKPVINDILVKLYQALNEHGVLIVSGDGVNADGCTPVDMVAGWLPYTLKGMDFGMPAGLVAEAALNAGFRNVHTRTIPSYSGTTELNIIRK